MYPDSTEWTPFSWSKTASRHQKQPPARVAISCGMSNSGIGVGIESAQNRLSTNMAQTTRPPRRPATREPLPEQAISREVLLEKYAKDGERTAAEVRARVARALAAAEPEGRRSHWEARFVEAMELGFIPAGRINSAAGTSLTATLINCFVEPVGDSKIGRASW